MRRPSFLGIMHYLLADEAGNFDFSNQGSAYFVVASVVIDEWTTVASQIIDLRHSLALQNSADLREEGFHATDDRQWIRDEVFKVIQSAPLIIDAVIMEKRKTFCINRLWISEILKAIIGSNESNECSIFLWQLK